VSGGPFAWLYSKVLGWAAHRHAPRYLFGLSFAESSFFPVPPDVMLAPMVLARPKRAWWLAGLTTVASVLGGVLGYLIGVLLFDQVGQRIIDFYSAAETFARVREWYNEYGVWIVALAAFTPVPYKVFTVASGVAAMPLLPFIAASAIGRGLRFFLVAALLYWGGAPLQRFVEKRIELFGWAFLVLVVAGFLFLRWR